ncbi:MAG: hypothetical protein UT92_C0001G0003 [Candidatus Curtissbacteria bacterium GW2011_GWA1_40_24]|uniref:LTD domain-containing protein n=2 Tax=Patescibacteria group TaxID=1783273 RepID=A0A0G0U870_9BACT|nr:MAG: hypothetical protein UT92_C0001G0003 [Candidatus Curtissbacteria bacterium GW2011_GWA1_40_24]KKR89000.1 MAG: hypothetical protein UU38_C0002G0003 [Candidatus Wolfebacteria bacterium GW2011_GWB1_41_12]
MNFTKTIIFLIIAAGIAIYVIGRAPEIMEGIKKSSETLKTPSKPRVQTVFPQTSYIAPSFQSVSVPLITSTAPQIPDYLIPSGFMRTQLSPYFNKVQISSVSSYVYADNPTIIGFYSSLSKEESINITGWKIKSNHGELIIPQGVEVWESSGAFSKKDIILSGSNYVNIYSNKSVVNENFRLNKCIGYLNNSNKFNPLLYQNCPLPYKDRAEIAYLSGDCQNYIFSLGNCRLPDVNFYNSFPGTDEGNACRSYLSTISYGSCFQNHRHDSDFLSNEWRIWVGENILDSQHDRLRIFDKQGLLVDEYIY